MNGFKSKILVIALVVLSPFSVLADWKPEGLIEQLTVNTNENTKPNQLVVYLVNEESCGSAAGYALLIDNGKNTSAAALLHSAFLSATPVKLEVRTSPLQDGRCVIQSVQLKRVQ
jgi:hypothetical protein